jgi:hypothetical protein
MLTDAIFWYGNHRLGANLILKTIRAEPYENERLNGISCQHRNLIG